MNDKQPISNVQWVNPEELRSNSYNPNHVFKTELRLLKISILETGWTQPIVARKDGEIIDGFHRWTLSLKDADIRKFSGERCPVVFVEGINKEDQIMATVRHNRARGQHGILAMGDLVRELQTTLTDKEIQVKLGMETEEVERLSEIRGSTQTKGKDSFGKGWVPVKENR